MTTPTAERLLTEEEFLALPDDPQGRKLELFDGKVICLSQPGEEHSRTAFAILFALALFADRSGVGEVFVDVGFKIRTLPDRVVNPDVAFVAYGTLPANRDQEKALPIAPLLAVEVVSPTDRDGDVAGKVLEYLAAGTQRVWVARPTTRTVTVHRPDGTARTYGESATLTSDDAGFPVEGFELPVANIFKLLPRA